MTRRILFTLAGVVAVTLTVLAQGGGRSGFDRANFDMNVRPQDDMFRHVNGGWLARTEIPADRPTYGTFVQIADKTEANLRALVETLAAQTGRKPFTAAQQVGDLYQSFMDEAAIERAGVTPIAARLAEIDKVSNTTELAALLGRMSMYGIPGPVGGFIENDVGDPTRNTLYLAQGGTALP